MYLLQVVQASETKNMYPLVNEQGNASAKGPFSIAMLVYRSVAPVGGRSRWNKSIRTQVRCLMRRKSFLRVARLGQWIFQVPVKGGRDYITPQKATYKWYISAIYCQLGDYMPPTTL